MNKEIEIPEGYEARIEGNKVILEKKESEDEGIRKFIIDCIDELRKANAENADFNGCCSEAIAYLEEHKEPTWTAEDESFVKHILPRILNPDKWTLDQISADKRQLTAFIERQKRKYAKEQQPAEWKKNFVEEVNQISKRYPEISFAKLCRIAKHFVEWGGKYKPAEWNEEDIKKIRSEEYTKGFNDAAFGGKLKEWSEEDKDYYNAIITKLEITQDDASLTDNQMAFLKSLPERFNLQPKQESEPMEIKYAGKIYKVYGTKEFPGGIVGYKIEDEPGHFDCIIHPDEVLGGGYGTKSCGSPYPTKEITFDEKPAEWSEEDEKMLAEVIDSLSDYEGLILYNSSSTSVEHLEKEISWFKSLPERFNLQPKQEWSEEDEKFINSLCDLFPSIAKNNYVGGYYAPDLVSRLKSLRPSWKPSKEQIEYLAKAVKTLSEEGDNKTASVLNELRLNLKKL